MSEETQSMLKDVYDKVCKIERLITGNGEPEKGLIIKVDRLTQSQKVRDRVFWLICAGLFTPTSIFALYTFITK